MSGQEMTYDETIDDFESGLLFEEHPFPRAYVDMRGIVKYAKERGITVEEMTRAEKDQFVTYYEDPSGYDLP
jgi:hypothetical protein